MFLSLNVSKMISICLLLCGSYWCKAELKGPPPWFFSSFSISTVCSPALNVTLSKKMVCAARRSSPPKRTWCRWPSYWGHKKTLLLWQRMSHLDLASNLLFPWVMQKILLYQKFFVRELALPSFHAFTDPLLTLLEIHPLERRLPKARLVVIRAWEEAKAPLAVTK